MFDPPVAALAVLVSALILAAGFIWVEPLVIVGIILLPLSVMSGLPIWGRYRA